MLDYVSTTVLDFVAREEAAPQDQSRVGSPQHPPRLLRGELRSLCERSDHRIAVKEGGRLVNQDEEFRDLYAVRAGSFKACVRDAQGREQRLGFFMQGDIIGFDAMETGRHRASFVAMEKAEVVAIPLDSLSRLSKGNPGLIAGIMRRMTNKLLLR